MSLNCPLLINHISCLLLIALLTARAIPVTALAAAILMMRDIAQCKNRRADDCNYDNYIQHIHTPPSLLFLLT